MISGKNVSIGTILWRILKQPLAQDLSYESAAEYAIEYLRLIGAPLSFIDEIVKIEINNYKALLPKNLLQINGIKYSEKECDASVAMRYASNIYHNDLKNDQNEYSQYEEYTYITQNNIITISLPKGFITISYKAISTDEHGYPLVPDNESFKMGLEYYILHRHLEGLWSMGKITDKVFSYYEQKRHFYSGQASTSLMVQGFDQLETMANAINRMIVQTNPRENFYKNFGVNEVIKQH